MSNENLKETMMIKSLNGDGRCRKPEENTHYKIHTSIIVKSKLILKKVSFARFLFLRRSRLNGKLPCTNSFATFIFAFSRKFSNKYLQFSFAIFPLQRIATMYVSIAGYAMHLCSQESKRNRWISANNIHIERTLYAVIRW